jgi:hypothetical protein
MSALDEILAAIKALPPADPGYDRVVMLGISARRSVVAACSRDGIDADYETLFAPLVVRTDVTEFDGWEIREIGEEGVWRDARPAT